MKDVFIKNRIFFILFALFFAVSLTVVAIYGKGESHLFLNSLHHPFADSFFSFITYFGDGLLIFGYLLIMVFISYRYTFSLAIAFSISGLIIPFLKKIFFHDWPRPSSYFDGLATLHTVPGVDLHCCRTFPSGHSATAFAVLFCFAAVLPKVWQKTAVFVSALVVAYSRVYLSQHFLADVAVGSLIGLLSGWMAVAVMQKPAKAWLDRRLFQQTKASGHA